MSLFNEKKVEDRNWEPDESDILEMEKLLTQLLINSGEEETQNLIDFSSDTSSTDEDTSGSEDDRDDGIRTSMPSPFRNPVRSSPANLYESIARSRETVAETPTKTSREISNLKSGKDSDFVSFQRYSAPFKINDITGSCNLCSWKSPDGSAESLLSHYKTAAHQMKLKERFLPEQTKPNDNANVDKDIHAGLLSSEKTFNVTQCKKQCNVQTDKTNKKKEPDQKPQEVQQQKVKRKRQRKKKTTQSESQSQESSGSKLTESRKKTISDLNVQALAKGMLCIQPMPGNNVSCKMCRKIIPKAADFDNLMKNVSAHLQSKKHLRKLSAAESSLKSPLSEDGRVKNSNEKKEEKAVEKKVENPGQKMPKHGEPGAAKTGKATDSGKGNTNKKKPENSPTADYQSKFLCMICNFFVNDSDKFNVHLKSKSHEDTFKSKGVNSGQYATCKWCKRLLFGSLYDINKHHSKCLGKKNGA